MCGASLPLNQFHRSTRSPDGLQARCKACQLDYKRARSEKVSAVRRAEVPEGLKFCPRCQTDLPLDSFHRLKRAKDGRQTYCRTCANVVHQEYRERNAVAIALRTAEKLVSVATRGTKVCTKCGMEKSVTSFYLHRGTKDGRTTYCGQCQSRSSAEWKARNLERAKEWQTAYTQGERVRRDAREHMRAWNLRKYGLTPEDYERMHSDQDGLCAICQQPERYVDPRTQQPRRLAVDHDHATGVVRGLLCGACNRSIGQFSDNHQTLERAAAYLKGAAELNN